ncbi:MAG: globin [Parasphingorhabdus sp.]
MENDTELIDESLATLDGQHSVLAIKVFERYIDDHPQFAHAFMNPEAARQRMTNETIEALVGAAKDEWWVDSTVINFVDLHHNYDDFTAEDYSEWFTLVIQTMAHLSGDGWPKGASAAWHRQAYALVEKIAEIRRNDEVPMRN